MLLVNDCFDPLLEDAIFHAEVFDIHSSQVVSVDPLFGERRKSAVVLPLMVLLVLKEIDFFINFVISSIGMLFINFPLFKPVAELFVRVFLISQEV